MKEWLYSRWRHAKTHHDYIIIGECRLESTSAPAYLYVRADDPAGIPWAREKDEFLDGRFVRMKAE